MHSAMDIKNIKYVIPNGKINQVMLQFDYVVNEDIKRLEETRLKEQV